MKACCKVVPFKMTQTKVYVDITRAQKSETKQTRKTQVQSKTHFKTHFISFSFFLLYSTNKNKSAHPSSVRQKPLKHIGRMENLKVNTIMIGLFQIKEHIVWIKVSSCFPSVCVPFIRHTMISYFSRQTKCTERKKSQ